MEGLVTSGNIVFVMLGFIAIELLVLLAYRLKSGRGIATIPLLTNIGAGVSLMLALYVQLAGYSWKMLAGCLLVSMVFHVTDLALRWRHESERPDRPV